MNKTVIKTRFAPSPTGFLHIGGLRTALYSYLFAKKNHGKVILRIEDTDQSRLIEGATENLIKTLTWAGIEFDEGPHKGGETAPYVQSERTAIYQKHAEILLEKGYAYRCFCTAERLEKMREEQKKKKVAPMYDRQCLYLKKEEIEKNLKHKIPYVVRLKIPHDQDIKYTDLIRGEMLIKGYNIDDQVLIKSDGFPTYHLANVVDDHLMGITHVIRGEEWLPSTPKHIYLYMAFDWKIPEFAHIPLILNPDKTKLSKRQGHVAVEDYISQGYLPEAIINYIALLGWNPGTEKEIFSLKELEQEFDLARVQKAGAIFDINKLNWFNKQYMQKLPLDEVYSNIKPYLKEKSNENENFIKQCLKNSLERLNNFSEAPQFMDYLLCEPISYDLSLFENPKMNVTREISIKALQEGIKSLEELDEKTFDDEEKMKNTLCELVSKLLWKNGQLFWPMRIALSNRQFSPGVFELICLFKKERAISRLKKALFQLNAPLDSKK